MHCMIVIESKVGDYAKKTMISILPINMETAVEYFLDPLMTSNVASSI